MTHTHFILLDDGRRRYYSIDDYRTRLVKTISQAQIKFLVRWLNRTQEMDVDTGWTSIIDLDEEYSIEENRSSNKSSSNTKQSIGSRSSNRILLSQTNVQIQSGRNL